MVTPRFSARGRSVSVASSAIERQVDGSRVNARWPARLSSSSASVRSIARPLTACRRSTSSPPSRFGSLRATSRSACVIASGVRSSCEALAANRCCSATWASSCASIASKASASSRNSSLRPGQLDAVRQGAVPAAVRVASVMRARGASIRPARNQPPSETEYEQERQHGRGPRGEDVQEAGSDRETRRRCRLGRRFRGRSAPGRGRSAGEIAIRRRAAGHRRASGNRRS